jgi:hypothetical protein
MYTHFASVSDFFHAVMTDDRHIDAIDDPLLWHAIGEYRMWLDEDPAYRKPFEEDYRLKVERRASLYRPSRPRPNEKIIWRGKRMTPREPTPDNRRLFELFGVDWRRWPDAA